MVQLSASKLGAIAIATLLLAACATTPGHPTGGPAPAPGQPSPYPPSSPQAPAPTPAPAPVPAPAIPPASRPDPTVTLALREQSLAAAARGDTQQAIALIERALRIEPNRAELWIDLARLHLDEGDTVGAEQFARKALLFTRDRPDLEQRAYTVISQAQRSR
jgi:tetratricopeptide (TPR) repeat protein